MDNNNHPSFVERIAELKARANELHVSAREGVVNLRAITEAADVMLAEAQRMEAAQSRFSARKGDRRQTTRASR